MFVNNKFKLIWLFVLSSFQTDSKRVLVWRSMHLTVECRDESMFVLEFNHISTTNLVFLKFVSSELELHIAHTPQFLHVDINLLQSRVDYSFSFSRCRFAFCFSMKLTKNSKANSIKRSALCRVKPSYKWKTNTQQLPIADGRISDLLEYQIFGKNQYLDIDKNEGSLKGTCNMHIVKVGDQVIM